MSGRLIKLRASGAPRWVFCPGAAYLEALFPDTESDAAREGTAAHWAAEEGFRGVDPMSLVGMQAPNGPVVTSDMAKHAAEYVAHVRHASAGFMVYVEEALSLDLPGVPVPITAHPDATHWNGLTNVLEVHDLKYGYGEVDPVRNPQLALYAFMKARALEVVGCRIETVRLTIHQPRLPHPDGRVRSWPCSRAELDTFIGEIAEAAQRAYTTRDTLTGEHCKNCDAAHACPALRRAVSWAIEVTGRALPENPDGATLAAEVALLRMVKARIKTRLDAIEDEAAARIKEGQIVPGWALERKLSNRQWSKPPEVIAALARQFGAKKSLMDEKLCTPAEAERRGMDERTMKILTTRSETGLKLVQRDLSAKAKEVFDNGNP